ncbi:MAG: hypothetical protein AB7I50_06245 [Vicinamibacterales bacterium]
MSAAAIVDGGQRLLRGWLVWGIVTVVVWVLFFSSGSASHSATPGMFPQSHVLAPPFDPFLLAASIASGFIALVSPASSDGGWWSGAARLVGSAFLSGGLIEFYAARRERAAGAFFRAGTVYFGRLLRLNLVGLLAGVVPCTALLRMVDAPSGRIAVGVLAVGLSVVFDVARVRLVIEDRVSVSGALVAGWRFVRRSPVAALVIWALCSALVAGTSAAREAGWPPLLAQAVAVAGVCLFYASWASSFQRALAWPGYFARQYCVPASTARPDYPTPNASGVAGR